MRIVGGIAIALFFGLMVGGMAYKVECPAGGGSTYQRWEFLPETPIPYLFPPSQSGCSTHSGTRVALSGIGLFPLKNAPTSSPANESQSDSVKYAEGVYVVISALTASNTQASQTTDYAQLVAHLEKGLKRMPKARRALLRLEPPYNLAKDHEQLVKNLDLLIQDTKRGLQATKAGDGAKLLKVQEESRVHNREAGIIWRRIRDEAKKTLS